MSKRSYFVIGNGLVNRCYSSYRNNCGCVVKSFEHPLVNYLNNEACYKLNEIADAQGPVASAIEMFKYLLK